MWHASCRFRRGSRVEDARGENFEHMQRGSVDHLAIQEAQTLCKLMTILRVSSFQHGAARAPNAAVSEDKQEQAEHNEDDRRTSAHI